MRIAGHDEIVAGLRFRGNSTFRKLPFKLDFDRYVKGQRFLGLKKLCLNNNYYDNTQVREAISFKVYRDAGVPASRTAFARVYLTIAGRTEDDGKVENEYLGLYTLIEQPDRGLLKRQTGAKGVLLKPSKQMLPYLGDNWDEGYEKAYELRTAVTPKAGQVVVDFARLMRDYQDGTKKKHSQQDFQTRLEKVLDVGEFLRYLAIPNKSRRVLWMPWDLNNSIGGMGQWTGVRFEELSIYRPTDLPLFLRILEVPEFKERYTKIVRELIRGPCSARRMTQIYQATRKTTASALAEEAKRSEIVTNFDGTGGRGKKKGAGNKAGGEKFDAKSIGASHCGSMRATRANCSASNWSCLPSLS